MVQTLFISVADMRRLVGEVGLSAFQRGVLGRLESDFSRWPEFEKSPRTANHSKVGVIELMPVSDHTHFSFKYVNGHPTNFRYQLPTVMAFGALSEVETGYPIMIAEMTILTAIRTAATSVMAAKLLSRRDSKSMAMIGNGAQSEFQILAFHHELGITEFHLYDVDAKATEKLLANLSGTPNIKLMPFSSTAEAVKGVDMVTTCTADKAYATILTPDMIEPGMHLNAIGGDCPGKTELHRDVVANSKVFVEYEPQSRIEGDIQQMPADFPVTEIWEVLTGKAVGRTSDRDVTVFDSVGFGLEDFSALQHAYAEAQRLGIGAVIDLIPPMADPKNIYGLLGTLARV
jgi:ornithine cyclodeaminase